MRLSEAATGITAVLLRSNYAGRELQPVEGESMRYGLLVGLVAAAAGCTTINRPVYRQQYEQVAIGKSTLPEVRALFGKPSDMLADTGIS